MIKDDHNTDIIELTNRLTIEDVKFIFTVWSKRMCAYDTTAHEERQISDVWINGTFLEFGIK